VVTSKSPSLILLLACVLASVAPTMAPAASVQDPDPQQRYNAAESAFAAGEPDRAVALFDALAADFPRSRHPSSPWRATAKVRAGEIDLALGRGQAAAARFVDVVEAEEASIWTARASLGLAATLVLDREWAAAATLLQQIVDADRADEPGADPIAAARASARLTLLHRLWLRPAAGEQPWQRAGRFVAGTTFDRPIGVAAGEDGVLITDEGIDTAVFVDSQGNAATFSVADPHRPWWSARGDAYVAARSVVSAPLRMETVAFAASDGSRQRTVGDIRAGARTAAGVWLLLDNDSRSVMRFGADSVFERVLDLGPDSRPVDLAIGPRGRIFVLEERRREVVVLDADGNLSGGFAVEGWRRPQAVATDALGHVYVLDRDLGRIDVFDPDGGILWTLGPTLPGGVELDDPRDIAVDATGRILVADRGLSAVVVIE